ncbi:LOC100909677 [Phodopus roborovskii]|uniref:LOC100909677 protein n=1 Tax=Phodopus roborovskii TaxID=109678 RepID=A0AAU9YYF7_PHORO|nr:LOC100909677 [Phodopus roborovskii]
MGDQRLPENHPGEVTRHKCVLKHKKEPLAFPPFMDGNHQFSHEKLEDFTRDYEKLPHNLRLFCSISVGQQGSRSTHYKQGCLSQKEDDAEDHFINLLQMSKHDWNLSNKHGKRLHRKFNLGSPENSRLCQRRFLLRNTSRNQNLHDSLNYRYSQRGGDIIYEWNETLGNVGVLQQFGMGHACQPSCKESSVKKVCHLPSKLKCFRKLSKEKDIRFSKQASSVVEMKLQKLHDPVKSAKEKFKYGSLYLEPKQLKLLPGKEPIADSKSFLEIRGRSFCKPDVLEHPYGTIAFKDFIKFFMRKGCNYNSVNIPVPSILKNHELIMQKQDDVDDENERGKELD